MKDKTIELDVDFIGGGEPLTKEEELAISAFISADKEKRKLSEQKKKSTVKATQKNKQPA